MNLNIHRVCRGPRCSPRTVAGLLSVAPVRRWIVPEGGRFVASGCIPERRKDPTIYRKGRKGRNGRRVTLQNALSHETNYNGIPEESTG